MWVISGPFDDVEGEGEKHKLLKPGREYTLGRKDQDLIVANKKVSSRHCSFAVGPMSIPDVMKPEFVPSLMMTNDRAKIVTVDRADTITGKIEAVVVNGNTDISLQHGDVVRIVQGIRLTVKWHELTCYSASYSRPQEPKFLEKCAKIGVHLTTSPMPSTTHFVTAKLSPSLLTATALLTLTKFVKPEWLAEVVALGKMEEGQTRSSLEKQFTLPDEKLPKYRPSLPSVDSLPVCLQDSVSANKIRQWSTWDPDHDRNFDRFQDFFSDIRFVIVTHEQEVKENVRDLILRGKGHYEGFALEWGRTRFHRVLVKHSSTEKKLVLIRHDVDEDDPGLVDLAEEAKSFDLRFLTLDHVFRAILLVDANQLHSDLSDEGQEAAMPTSSPIPSIIPPTHPTQQKSRSTSPVDAQAHDDVAQSQHAESSHAPAGPVARRPLKRRAPSREASEAPPAVTATASSATVPDAAWGGSDAEVEVRPKRTLVRRAKAAKPMIVGVDDPSHIIDEDMSQPTARNTEKVEPPTPARSGRLKRRVGTSAAALLVNSDDIPTVSMEPEEEPPLKRFKALFEESARPDAVDEDPDAMFASIAQQTQSYTQPESRMTDYGTRSGAVSSLAAVPEEEEESQMTDRFSVPRAGKRKAPEQNGEDVDMDGPPAKRRTVDQPQPPAFQHASAVVNPTSKPPSSRKPLSTFSSRSAADVPAAGTSKPSSKTAAATSKPDQDPAFLKALATKKKGKKNEDQFDREFNNLRIAVPDAAEEEREEDWNVLADFGDDSGMRGNFMVVVEMEPFRPQASSATRRVGTRPEWEGRPDFKKFKKKTKAGRQQPVPLFVDDDSYDAVWGRNTQSSQSQRLTQPRREPASQRPLRQPEQSFDEAPALTPVVESEDEGHIPPKPSSRAKSAGSAPPRRTANRRPSPTPQPLFLDSDGEADPTTGRRGDDAVDEEPAHHGTGETLTLRSSGKAATQTRASTRRSAAKKAPTVTILDDDSDDGSTFKGFGKRKRR
ncbi:hypothetical protein PUNSTDRAFT_138057 [Punctularia strigosozonata HHB-11173 SS5]|uniref:FHA domain-containing protein n=1 Tax=Punctularia strigosozonata (strain HHB-11173) TaxID=741275 RepID=R7S3S5_PUNST|nr:uncharacterized protein PUNSTDRAFT_138057 [Punctularia strigosozonata HHB-11173 SS5]EIN04858.1 hypothetical protein PUNSTDRAFT_138057 [Punctularia strigosozonata HHB-11173 SS5]